MVYKCHVVYPSRISYLRSYLQPARVACRPVTCIVDDDRVLRVGARLQCRRDGGRQVARGGGARPASGRDRAGSAGVLPPARPRCHANTQSLTETAAGATERAARELLRGRHGSY